MTYEDAIRNYRKADLAFRQKFMAEIAKLGDVTAADVREARAGLQCQAEQVALSEAVADFEVARAGHEERWIAAHEALVPSRSRVAN